MALPPLFCCPPNTLFYCPSYIIFPHPPVFIISAYITTLFSQEETPLFGVRPLQKWPTIPPDFGFSRGNQNAPITCPLVESWNRGVNWVTLILVYIKTINRITMFNSMKARAMSGNKCTCTVSFTSCEMSPKVC